MKTRKDLLPQRLNDLRDKLETRALRGAESEAEAASALIGAAGSILIKTFTPEHVATLISGSVWDAARASNRPGPTLQ